ncbi:MAG: hypothetical protein C0184_12235 [Chloroflexus aggregans]|uniref:Uncharacterized protein n=1 Tax=Chloroflexus aggregans TaxID=152260 RepID=A0A2J6X0A9_9CHLR|nr:MAG: hypothetical protein C0184_12235 [Chloroflexus aggregans]
MLDRLATGQRVGHDRLPSPLIGSLVEQIWGHTRVIPILLLPLALVSIVRRGITWNGYVLIGYVVVLLGAIVVDWQFSLWNKHWYFSLPALAFLRGIALDTVCIRSRAGRVVATGLVGYLWYESVAAWLVREFLYQWSLQTL